MPRSDDMNGGSLQRQFRAILFDWDGTAVRDRVESGEDLARLLSRVLEHVPCVIVTGTSLEKILGQCIDLIENPVKGNLFVCSNRGSEVFGFDREGRPESLFRRLATSEENAALDRAADLFCEKAAVHGIDVEIVRDRLNRRKLDLIPLVQWKDPKKSEVKELLAAVQERLLSVGAKTALKDLIDLAKRCSADAGVMEAKITSDIKHIEIGLTDKGDSMRWASDGLLKKRSISPSDVLVVGDEFGPIGGIPGSDSLLKIPALDSATFVSVGLEPEGAPDWVIWIGGGPERFLKLLEEQIQSAVTGGETLLLRRGDPDPSWSLEQEGFDPSRERDLEALFTVGNGYLGVRGSLSIPIPSSQTDVFIAGIYDQKRRAIPYSELEFIDPGGREDPYTEIVPFPSPFELELVVDGKEVALETSDHAAFKRQLDLKGASLHESMKWVFQDGRGLSVAIARMASLKNQHLLVQEIEVKATAGSMALRISPKLLGSDLATKHVHLMLTKAPGATVGVNLACLETSRSRFHIALGCRTWCDGAEVSGPDIGLALVPGKPARVLRVISIHTSRESAEPMVAAKAALGGLSFDVIRAEVDAHREEWGCYWRSADIRFVRHPELTEAQRFNSFQLRAVANEDPTTGIGARALSGRAYEGHVFWDTEIFTFPFLLHVDPRLAKSNLDYRYRTLDGARRRARVMGFSGACYAWESTVTGDDVTPHQLLLRSSGKSVPIFTGAQQIHITADVAHAVSSYWDKTGDTNWMLRSGIEILVETARFWASRVTKSRGQFHILRVVGPDEYHHDVDDNAYTNWMARQNLSIAAQSCLKFADLAASEWGEVEKRMKLRAKELASWNEIAAGIFIPLPNSDGVIEQFSGYFKLRAVPLRHGEELKAPLDRLLEWERVSREQLIKQADVLMIPFLFPDAFPKEIVEANYRYYEPRTDHGSSLSPSVHAAIAAQIGNWDDAERFWKMGLQLDLLNLMRNTALGIHPGNMASTWQALMFHILALRNSPGNSPVKERFIEKYGPIELQLGGQTITIERDEVHTAKEEGPWASMAKS